MAAVTETYIEVNGGKLPCIKFGNGEKPLVMIPGLRTASVEGTGKFAARYYRIFAKDCTVYILDRKDSLPENCTIRGIADDTAAAMRKLGIKDAYVFGVSQGGAVAQEIAINYPELVGKLVLAVTASRCNSTLEDAIKTWIDMISRGDVNGFTKDYMYRGYSEKYIRKYKLFLPLALKVQKMMPAERFINLSKACLTIDTYDRLGGIKCPVFVIGADCDKVVSGEASREIAEKLGCELYMYEGLSHEAYNEAKDFNHRVYDFFMK